MHPHIADLMATDHVDRLRAEADRGRLVRESRSASTGRPSWRSRLASIVHHQPARRELGAATRQG